MKPCPKCNSKDTTIEYYIGIRCLICKNCGYDERDIFEVYQNEKKSQKAKGSYSPYKAGGSKRTIIKK